MEKPVKVIINNRSGTCAAMMICGSARTVAIDWLTNDRPALPSTKAMLVTGQDTGSIFEAVLIEGKKTKTGRLLDLGQLHRKKRSKIRLERV